MKAHYRNRSPFGWWIASYIERFEFYDEDTSNPRRRCMAWENTIILKAKGRDAAYRKAVRIARSESGVEWSTRKGRRGAWRFQGLTDLLPIHDDLVDGAEVSWVDHSNKTFGKVQSMIRRKAELSVFDDSDDFEDRYKRITAPRRAYA